MAGSDGETEDVVGMMDTGEGGEEYGLSQSAPDGSAPDRNSRFPPGRPRLRTLLFPGSARPPAHASLPLPRRLARKAESARQARLRHKQFVTELQGQVDAAQERVRQLESFCTQGPGSAAVAVQELRGALAPDQLQQLQQWCAAHPARSSAVARGWLASAPHIGLLRFLHRSLRLCAQAHRGAGGEPRAEALRELYHAPAAAAEIDASRVAIQRRRQCVDSDPRRPCEHGAQPREQQRVADGVG